jgi:hypothetical protein
MLEAAADFSARLPLAAVLRLAVLDDIHLYFDDLCGLVQNAAHNSAQF